MTVPVRLSAGPGDALELLSASLLDRNRATVERLRGLADRLGTGLGWHYLLDLSWVLEQANVTKGSTVVDAGAGTGVIQWYLALEGCTVVSVDRASRRHLPNRFRAIAPVEGMRDGDLAPPRAGGLLRHAARPVGAGLRMLNVARATLRGYRPTPRRAMRLRAPARAPIGRVVIYNQDLRQLDDIADGSIDTIVSVSALEHNDPAALPDVVDELLRILKPGGRLVATLGASSGEDWFHVPSRGWCYSERTLRRVFDLGDAVRSNYGDFDRLLEEVRASTELRRGLAPFYFLSGANGMPWGKWDPQYLSVGVCKVKR